MHAALVPVRSITGAKKRLATHLDKAARKELALAMLADMIKSLTAARSLDRIVVVSADQDLLGYAAGLGVDVIDEQHPRGLNGAVTLAAALLEREGVRRLLAIPGDVPLLDAKEIDRLFATDPHRCPVVLVPSASGLGTNGLLMSPPTVIEPCFEGSSLDAHRRLCRRRGIEALVLALPGFALDVDTPDDLSKLLARQALLRSTRLERQAVPDGSPSAQPPIRATG